MPRTTSTYNDETPRTMRLPEMRPKPPNMPTMRIVKKEVIEMRRVTPMPSLTNCQISP